MNLNFKQHLFGRKCLLYLINFITNALYSMCCPKSKKEVKGIKKEICVYKKKMQVVSIVLTFIVIFCLVILASYYLISYFSSSSPEIDQNNNNLEGNSLNAALIDALYSTLPNEKFTKSLNETLHTAGFKVDIFQGEEVTVNFLKKLPSGYKLIILRMHSALAPNGQLYLFTAEPYSPGKYTQEQYFQIVKEAYANEDSQPVFAVNWGFIKRCMKGKFKGALVILMGCDGMQDPLIIKEILNQGAIGYIAWTGPVSLSHSDKAILHLIRALYIEKIPLPQAVEKINSEIGEDPNWGTILDYRASK